MYTVMVVDDNDSIRRGLALIFRHSGYRVVMAADGLEAIQMSDELIPDVLLLDLSMPGMDGLSLLELLREHRGWESLPVIIYTAVNDPVVRRKAERLGAETITKGTVTWDELVAKVRWSLQPHAATEQPMSYQSGTLEAH